MLVLLFLTGFATMAGRNLTVLMRAVFGIGAPRTGAFPICDI
jgi:hypothetical protein